MTFPGMSTGGAVPTPAETTYSEQFQQLIGDKPPEPEGKVYRTPDGQEVRLTDDQVAGLVALQQEHMTARQQYEASVAAHNQAREEYQKRNKEMEDLIAMMGQPQQTPAAPEVPAIPPEILKSIEELKTRQGLTETEHIVQSFASAHNMSMDQAMEVVDFACKRNIPALSDAYKVMNYDRVQKSAIDQVSTITPPGGRGRVDEGTQGNDTLNLKLANLFKSERNPW